MEQQSTEREPMSEQATVITSEDAAVSADGMETSKEQIAAPSAKNRDSAKVLFKLFFFWRVSFLS